MDQGNPFNRLTSELRAFRDERDWAQFHSPRNLAASVSIEAAELLEIFQWSDSEPPFDSETQARLRDEIADVAIYLLLLSDRVDVDLVDAVEQKIAKNRQRFKPSN